MKEHLESISASDVYHYYNRLVRDKRIEIEPDDIAYIADELVARTRISHGKLLISEGRSVLGLDQRDVRPVTNEDLPFLQKAASLYADILMQDMDTGEMASGKVWAKLNHMATKGLLAMHTLPQRIQDFMRTQAKQEIANILAGKWHRSNLQDIALAAANQYEKNGILSVETDEELFDSLTSQM